MLNGSSGDLVTGSPRWALARALSRMKLSAIQRLILSAVVLVIAIMLGTGYFALQYRERALEVAERELSNSALLLSRHFDQQLSDLQHVHDDVVASLRADGVHTSDEFEKKMSTLGVHEMLRTKLAALPHVGAFNLWNANGWLINSSEMWPVPDASIANRRYYQDFISGQPTPDLIVEPVVSKVTKVWTTVFARKIIGRNGEIIGIASRGVEPRHFEAFVGSLALDSGTAISMIHRDGTIIARYPKDDSLIGHNVANTSAFQRALAVDGDISGRFTSARLSEDKVGAVKLADAFSDPDRRDHQDIDRARRLAGADQAAVLRRGADGRRHHRHGFPDRAPAAPPARCRAAEAVGEDPHLDTAINNMTQGLLLFDAAGRLVICNRQYIDMFGLSPDVVKPGCHLRDLIKHRQQLGSFVGDVDAYCAKFLDPSIDLKDSVTSTPDGRSIRLIFKRSPDGGWATTMEDVTEGRRVQAKIEHLAHYDALTNLPNRTLFQRHAEKLLLVARRRVRHPLHRHRRIQAHQRFTGTSDRRRVSQGCRGSVSPVGRRRRTSSRASAGMSSQSCSTASRAPRTFTRWWRGSIRRCGRRSTAMAISSPAMPASASRSRRAMAPICSTC